MKIRLSKILNSFRTKQFRQLLVFLCLAFMFLVLTKLSKEYTKEIKINVVITNIPQSNALVRMDSVVTINAKSSGYNFIPYLFKNPKITLDAENDLSLINNSYYWVSSTNSYKVEEILGSDFQLFSVKPDTLLFEIQKMATVKVPVNLNATLTYATGYDSFYGARIKPDSVLVIGPKNIINDIETINTEPIELKRLNTNVSNQVSLIKPKTSSIIELSEKEVELSVVVEKFTEGTLKIPVTLINVPEEITINFFPKEVLVSYYTSLEDYKTINAAGFKVVADYKTVATSSNGILRVLLETTPAKVKKAKLKRETINIIIEE